MINASKRSLFLCIALLMPFIYLLANSTDYHPPLKLVNSPFTFTETEITAHPGETVQVCVDKVGGGLVFGTTSIVVDAVGNTSPHLSDFTPITLGFPFGVTRACFDLVVNSDEVTSEYRLVIHGTFEALIILVKETESLHGLCGVFPPHTAESDNGEIVFYDRFGNSYPLKDLQSSNHQTARQLLGNDGDSGYFDLIFDPEMLDLSEEELQVVCDVFRDLSEIVQRPMSQNNCGTAEFSNVRIELTTNVPENPLELGVGSPYFLSDIWYAPAYPTMESLVFRKINGGGVWSEDGLDGGLNINPNILWHTDWENAPDPAAVVFDLYSVVLHEALHILGYASTLTPGDIFEEIPAPGVVETESLFASKWDHLLRLRTLDNTGVADPSFTPLLSQIDQTVFYEFNDATFPNPNALFAQLNDNCTDPLSTITVGWDIPVAVSGMDGGVITTAGSYLNALSHLHRNCGNGDRDFVMLPGFNVREQRQEILAEELAILCDLGYNIEGCNSCFVSPNLEGVTSSVPNYDFFTTCCTFETRLCVGEEHLFSFNDLLCNEIHNIDAEVMITGFSVSGQAQDIIQVDYESETISLTPASEGDFQIYYNLESCEGMPVLSTVFFTSIPCFDCAEVPVCENIICTNDFNFEENTGVGDLIFGTPWAILNDNTPDICVDNEDNGVLLIAAFESNREGVSIELEAPIPPGCIVNISFDGLSSQNTVGALEFYGSMIRPCPIWETRINAGEVPTFCENSTYNPVRMQVVPIENTIVGNVVGCQQDEYDFVNYDFSWENNTDESLGFITFYSRASGNFIVLDNLIVNLDCTTAGFEFEANCLEIILMANIVDENIMHSWDLGDDNTVNGNTVEYAYAESGTYTITHTATDICGNETTTMAEIIVVDCCFDLDPAFTYTQDCEAGEVILTASNTDGTHSWEVDGVTYDGLSITLTITDPTVPFTATVTHTVENECGESNAITLVIDDLEACEGSLVCDCPEGGLTVYAGEGRSIWETDLAPFITNNTLNTNNRCVAISGRLLIPAIDNPNEDFVDLAFFPGEVRMQPGAEIVIEEGATVQFRTSGPSGNPALFSGCESLWQRITVESNASFTMTGIHIEDAQAAVHPMDNAIVELRDNSFRKNFIGVYHFGEGFELLSSSGNSFDGSESLLPPLSTSNPFPTPIGSQPYAGLYLQFSTAVAPAAMIGVPQGEPNVFSNLPVGVYAGGMIDVLMTNNRFSDIQPSSEDTYPLEGEAVYMNGFAGASLQFNGTLNSFPRAFENCYRGILTRNTATEIFNTSMDCYAVGIQIENCNAQIHLHENTLRLPGWGIGINLLQNNGATDLLIEHNDITIETPVGGPLSVTGGKGIAIEEANARPDEYLAEVSYNTININSGVNDGGLFGDDPRYRGAGIFLNSVNNLDLEYNRDIHCLFTDDIGILVQNCEDLLLLDNHVFGISGSVGTGILAEASQDVTYSCNGMLYLRHGLEFTAGTALGSNIVQNNFIPPMTNGLVYRDMLTIEGQAHRENRWSGSQNSYFGAAALNEGSDPTAIEAQQYSVTPSFLPPSISVPSLGGQQFWFITGSNPTPLSPCTLESFTTPENGELYRKIADGTAISGAYLSSRQWANQRALYKSLEAGSINNSLSTEMQTFYNTASTGRLGNYHSLAERRKDTQAVTEITNWRNRWETKRSLLQELANMRIELLGESSTTYTWQDHANLQANLTEENNELLAQRQNTVNERQLLLDNLSTQNANLGVELLVQQNEKELNEVLLETVLSSEITLTNDQQQFILNIGNQCPLEGGEVVYMARSLYQLIDPTHEFPNTCITAQALQGEGASGVNQVDGAISGTDYKISSEQVEFRVYPNPAKDKLMVSYNNATRMEMFTTLGAVVLESVFEQENGQSAVDVTHLIAGVYYIRLHQTDGTVQTKKVVISH